MWWHLDDSYNMKTDQKKYQPSLPAKDVRATKNTIKLIEPNFICALEFKDLLLSPY